MFHGGGGEGREMYKKSRAKSIRTIPAINVIASKHIPNDSKGEVEISMHPRRIRLKYYFVLPSEWKTLYAHVRVR